MSEPANYYGANSEQLDELRDRLSGHPDCSEAADLLEANNTDPKALGYAAGVWWIVASWGMNVVRECEIPNLPAGFTKLTNALVLWCDLSQLNLDASPLRDFHDALYAREGELHDLVSSACWTDLDEMNEILARGDKVLRRALVVTDRLRAIATAHTEDHIPIALLEPNNSDEVFQQRVQMVREVLADSPKASQKEIQKELRRRFRIGMRNETLIEVLDYLRANGEYSILPRKRSMKGK